MTRRLLGELGRRHLKADIDASLGSLVVDIEDDVAVITRTSDPTGRVRLLSTERLPRAARVRIAPGGFTQTPTSEARVRLLAAASSIADRVELHAPTTSTGTHRGRLAIDLPRRLARTLGVDVAEPGDRFEEAFSHVFFDDEAIIEEARRAGLAYGARRGASVLLERAPLPAVERRESFAAELARAVGVIRDAERHRLHDSPARAVHAMRERGRRTNKRGPIGRARLRRAIGWVDAGFRGGPNCFRRTLAELALDAGAAEETLVFGLDVGRTGHVALKDSEDCTFDVAFEIAPEPAGRGES